MRVKSRRSSAPIGLQTQDHGRRFVKLDLMNMWPVANYARLSPASRKPYSEGYSARSSSIGLMRAARRAGTYEATSATPKTTANTVT